ncbi:MAG: class I SAM-dependent methyltransferase [Bacteroidales bacterium]|jgi:SAM-dependent methyltransferase|nr:class I SAM-dependent methyltransferase [Bacteroidales bacterium]
MQKRHKNHSLYFEEQTITTQKYVIPYIEDMVATGEETVVLEIGCGQGGNLKPFLDRGLKCIGIDISKDKIASGRELFQSHPHYKNLELIEADIYTIPEHNTLKADVIIMRDVIEHLPNQDYFMGFIKRFLKKDGIVFYAFPPWRMPFGGHQQVLRHKFLSKLPYYHILPKAVYRMILKMGNLPESTVKSMLEIKETGISICRFRKLLKKNNYEILKATDWFINPNYEIKFNLKPRKLIFFNRIPFFRDFITTCYYCVVKPK